MTTLDALKRRANALKRETKLRRATAGTAPAAAPTALTPDQLEKARDALATCAERVLEEMLKAPTRAQDTHSESKRRTLAGGGKVRLLKRERPDASPARAKRERERRVLPPPSNASCRCFLAV